ncbi:hypothetical protein EMMF5_001538 [Cystobasidiomycetes sp. EMM_F5]
MQGQVDAAREYMEANSLDDDDLKESMLSGSPPKPDVRAGRRASRSGQKDVGDVSDDDFESQNRALSPSGRASGQTSKAGRTNSSSSVPRNSTTNKDPNPFVADGDENDTGSADQGLDSNSGMNKGEKEHCTDTAVQAVGRDAEMPAMRFSTCEPAERRRYV